MDLHYHTRATCVDYGFCRGPRPSHSICFFALILALLGGCVSTPKAQQTLFNVPSADVLDKGKIYGEVDVACKLAEPRLSSFVPRIVVGVGGGGEIGLNVIGNIQPGADTTTLVPAIKWKLYDGAGNGWALLVGNTLFIPLRIRSYDVGNYFYAEVSKTLSTRTRLTLGGYHFTRNVVAANARRAGGQFGFEQPVTKRLTIQADWLTGRHANGYFTPGFAYKLNSKLTGYFGYSLGNGDVTNGNHFFYSAVGFNFN